MACITLNFSDFDGHEIYLIDGASYPVLHPSVISRGLEHDLQRMSFVESVVCMGKV